MVNIFQEDIYGDVSGRERSKYGALTVFLSLINTIFVQKIGSKIKITFKLICLEYIEIYIIKAV